MIGHITFYYRNRMFHEVRCCISFDLDFFSEFDGHPVEKDTMIRSHFMNNNLVYEDYELFDVSVYICKGKPIKPECEVKIDGKEKED